MLAPDSLEFSHSSANLIMEELGYGLEGCLRTNGASQRVDSQNGNWSILLWAPLLRMVIRIARHITIFAAGAGLAVSRMEFLV